MAKEFFETKKHLDQVDWNAELVRGDLGKAVQQLKRQAGMARIIVYATTS